MELLSLLSYVFLTFILLNFLSSLLGINRKHMNLPPGPVGLPVIGNLLQVGRKPHRSLADLAKTYGPIMSLKLGQITTVVISSPTIAKEIFQKQDLAFGSRWISSASHAQNIHKHSVALLPVGDKWRIHRKILNSKIFSGSMLDNNIAQRQQKVQELISFVGKCCKEGKAVEIGRAAFTTGINLLSNNIFSVDLADPHDLESPAEVIDLLAKVMVEAGKPNLVDLFPMFSMFDPQGVRRRLSIVLGKILQLLDRMVDDRLELRKSSQTKPSIENDLIDFLLNMIEDNKTEQLDRTDALHLCMSLLLAGSDTTSSSIEWIMAELLHNPKILARAKAELEQTVGPRKQIDEADVAQLPYLRAIVKESLRMHMPAPLLMPRMADTDVELCGYTVPKGTQLLVNAWAISNDPQVWSNPTCFMPERFLDIDIDVRGQDFELIPFGSGWRICPGLPLLVRVVPVIVGSLINLFDWKIDGGISPEEMDMEDEFVVGLKKAQPLRAVPICG